MKLSSQLMDQVNVEQLSPMMRQYVEMKRAHQDQLLFYRLGDFYEMFFDDAVLVSRELELTLTGRDCGLPERAPMCGVPYHSVDTYIARLIKKGYKVAICEQLENPALAKGMVKRDIIRVVTPGTLIESDILDEGSNNFICSICCGENGCGLSFCDISTGEMNVTQLEGKDQGMVINELGKFRPNEIIYNAAFMDRQEVIAFIREKLCCTADQWDEEYFEENAAQLAVLQQFGVRSLLELGLEDMPLAVESLGGLIAYLRETQRTGMERIQTVKLYNEAQYMRLDLTARKNLELTETMRSREKRGSLLWVLDKTRTAMGKRLMKATIEQPLISAAIINRRLNAVEELTGDGVLTDNIVAQLTGIYDMERLMTKIVYGSASPGTSPLWAVLSSGFLLCVSCWRKCGAGNCRTSTAVWTL